MKKMLFIMNPCAGKKKANRHYLRLVELFNRAGYQVLAYITEKRGDATVFAREMAGQVDAIVCCGGDGTFNETLCGAMQAGAKTPLGYIPAGSTNDFANTLKLPTNILKAAQNIVNGKVVGYDTGLFNDRYFSYIASFGAFTKTSYATSQNIKNILGHMAYILSSVTELTKIHKIYARFEMDGEVVEDDFLFGAVCNSTSVAGVVKLDRSVVDLQDGKFEILLVRAPKSIKDIRKCIQAIHHKTYDCEMLTFRSAAEVKVRIDESVDWTLDGEYQKGTPEILLKNCHLKLPLLTAQEE